MNDVKIRKLSTFVDRLATNTAGALTVINKELLAIRGMILQNCLALDLLLMKEDVVCKVIHTLECCAYVQRVDK